MLAWCGALLAAVVELTGVTGSDLRARAFFDANNVRVGDPLVLTVDFLGEAEFRDLHPPELSKCVDRRDWKLDDASAKTDTYRDARRITYRVRPMRAGVLWFPGIEFSYEGPDGAKRIVRANEIPVHAKAGAQVVVAGMHEETDRMPEPPELVEKLPASVEGALTDDQRFAWRKACAKPTADAFAAFDTVEGQLNAATCAIRAGNWARALKIYGRLEWRCGQTAAIERGIVAALALKYDNPAAELPVWRQVLRPLLRFAWLGRVSLVVGGLLAAVLVFWLLGRGIRAVAVVAVALALPQVASAQDIFEQMEREMEQMRQRMNRAFGGPAGGFSFGGAAAQEPVRIVATVDVSRRDVRVGEPFDYVISLDLPKTATLGQLQLSASETFGLKVVGESQNLADGVSANPSNTVRRITVPVRYDVPFSGKVAFTVGGMVSNRQAAGGRGRRVNFSFSTSFRVTTPPVAVKVKPLPSAGQPKDYAGIVSEGMRVHETCDLVRVGTNDVVTITYRMFARGYVPKGFLPPGAAFEWGRDEKSGVFEYRRYFVADGKPKTPVVEIPYYDPRTKRYVRAKTGGTPLAYAPDEEAK